MVREYLARETLTRQNCIPYPWNHLLRISHFMERTLHWPGLPWTRSNRIGSLGAISSGCSPSCALRTTTRRCGGWSDFDRHWSSGGDRSPLTWLFRRPFRSFSRIPDASSNYCHSHSACDAFTDKEISMSSKGRRIATLGVLIGLVILVIIKSCN